MDYSVDHSELINVASEKGRHQTVIYVGESNEEYDIDLVNKTLTNERTGFSRLIRFVPSRRKAAGDHCQADGHH
jgi:hypothetical protein